jgi:hypothetical protein
MTEKTDETGKGHSKPGEAPKRPYATIEVQATEIGSARVRADAGAGVKPEGARAAPTSVPARLWAACAALTGWLGLAAAWALGLTRRLARSGTVLSHAAAGAAGAVLVLAVASLLGLLTGGQRAERVSSDLARRLAAVEKALQERPVVPQGLSARLAATDTRLAKIEERTQAAEAKLAADRQALEARIAASSLAQRIAKIEAALAALPTEGRAQTATTADVEKLAGEASEAKAASARSERELAALKSEAAGLRQGLEALKGSLDDRLKGAAKAGDLAPLLARLAAMERDVGAVARTEGERAASSQQVLLTLEIANLKRAIDRGDSYASELDAVRKAAGSAVDLTALDRSSRTGVPTLGVLAQEFRHVANAAIDAENERAESSVLDRLMAGARSVVRLRKANYDADDTSVEATLARMDAALKDGHLGEVLAQSKRLPPKAALAAEGWLHKLEARTAADRAVADLEAALKASLSPPGQPVPETKR